MKIDWFDFWLIFSILLVLFVLIGVIIRFSHWFKFKKELAYIKKQKISDIVKKTYWEYSSYNELSKNLDEFKEEMDVFKKDVCFDLYDRGLSWDDTVKWFDLEESLEKILDGKILDLIKEKDVLLKQKDIVIASLEEKNQKILRDVVNKMFLLLIEKNKLIREKDWLIIDLRWKIHEISSVNLDNQISNLLNIVDHPSEHQNNKEQTYYNDFVNVNFIAGK